MRTAAAVGLPRSAGMGWGERCGVVHAVGSDRDLEPLPKGTIQRGRVRT